MTSIEFIAKVDSLGRMRGYDAERMPSELRDKFAGSFVKITITGWVQTPEQMRRWYWAGILPEILKAMRQAGNPVHPKSKDDIEWLHKELKKAYIPPQMDEHRQVILKNGLPVHTTSGMDSREWYEYLQAIQRWALEQFDIELNPEKRTKDGINTR